MRIDLQGTRINKLSVLWPSMRIAKPRLWVCRCQCGKLCDVSERTIRGGTAFSCGCVHPNLKHGMSGTPEYHTWHGMHYRCTNPKAASWKNYGARGIRVCQRWSDIKAFLYDMGPRPEDHTIDRIDSDGNYEPSNCRWATWQVQNDPSRWTRPRAKRSDIYIIRVGERRLSVSELSKELGISTQAIYQKIARLEKCS